MRASFWRRCFLLQGLILSPSVVVLVQPAQPLPVQMARRSHLRAITAGVGLTCLIATLMNKSELVRARWRHYSSDPLGGTLLTAGIRAG